MGASQSTCAAAAAADRGWPAYMSAEVLRRAMLRFPAEKSVLSDRVRFRHEGGAHIEYVRLPGGTGSRVTYQRRDAEGHLPTFPRHLARQELPGAEDMPHEVVEARPDAVRVRHPGNDACATYVLRQGGTWARDDSVAARLWQQKNLV